MLRKDYDVANPLRANSFKLQTNLSWPYILFLKNHSLSYFPWVSWKLKSLLSHPNCQIHKHRGKMSAPLSRPFNVISHHSPLPSHKPAPRGSLALFRGSSTACPLQGADLWALCLLPLFAASEKSWTSLLLQHSWSQQTRCRCSGFTATLSPAARPWNKTILFVSPSRFTHSSNPSHCKRKLGSISPDEVWSWQTSMDKGDGKELRDI